MDVLEYFELKEQPFRIGPDPRFLYLSDQVQETLAKCEYMARERVGPLYIIGSGRRHTFPHSAPWAGRRRSRGPRPRRGTKQPTAAEAEADY